MTAQELEKAVCHIRKDLKEYEIRKLEYNEKPYGVHYDFGYHFNKHDLFHCVPWEWENTFKAIKETLEKEGYKVLWWEPENNCGLVFYTLGIYWE